LRPAIVNRKSWGGNRTSKGARTQQITMSVIRTARQQGIDSVELMTGAQRSRQPTASELIKLPARASPTSLAARDDARADPEAASRIRLPDRLL